MKRIKSFGKRILRVFLAKNVFFNASAITFNLLLCAIPFTLILISIVGYLLSIEQAYQEVLRYGQELLPRIIHQGRETGVIGSFSLKDLLNPLIQKRRIYGIVGISVLILFSLGLFSTIKHSIFEIFDIEDRKHPIMEWLYNFLAFGVVGGVFVFFSIVISIITLLPLNEIALNIGNLEIQFGWLYAWFNLLLPTLFTFFLIYAIFRFLSERRIPHLVSLVGAAVYTVLFEIAKYGISLYLEQAFNMYLYFYQGYSIIVLIGLWAFYTAFLLVLCTIIARAYQDVYFLSSKKKLENPYDQIS